MCPQMLPQLFNIGRLIMIWDLLGAIGACTVAICILSLTGASQFASVFEEGGEVVVMVVLLVEVVMVVVVEGELLAICIGFRRRRSILPCRLGQAKAVKQTFTSLSHFHFRRLSNYSTFRSRCVGNTLVVSLVEKRGGGNICDHKLQTPESSGKSASAQPRLSSMRSHLLNSRRSFLLLFRKKENETCVIFRP